MLGSTVEGGGGSEEGAVREGGSAHTHVETVDFVGRAKVNFWLAAHFKALSKQTLHPQCYMTAPLPPSLDTDIQNVSAFCSCASHAVQVNQQRRLTYKRPTQIWRLSLELKLDLEMSKGK